MGHHAMLGDPGEPGGVMLVGALTTYGIEALEVSLVGGHFGLLMVVCSGSRMTSTKQKKGGGQFGPTLTGGCHVSPVLPTGSCCTEHLHGCRSSHLIQG